MTTAEDKARAKALQADLITLGYLPKNADNGVIDAASTRALKRFQRHAARTYRMTSSPRLPADVVPALAFKGTPDGKPDAATLAEIKKWLDNKWTLPLGRFALKKVGTCTLREDVSDAWFALAQRIKALGGTIDGPYGNSKRGPGKATKVGASSFSFHIVGRAIDLQQALADPGSGRRYYVARDTDSAARDYWRIYCKTINQDGTQGKLYNKGDVKCQSFSPMASYDLPKGYYLDLTTEIEKDGLFERIPAQGGWDTNYNKTEWWHFQYVPDKQETFLDECELIGVGEAELKKLGYTIADMDGAPG